MPLPGATQRRDVSALVPPLTVVPQSTSSLTLTSTLTSTSTERRRQRRQTRRKKPELVFVPLQKVKSNLGLFLFVPPFFYSWVVVFSFRENNRRELCQHKLLRYWRSSSCPRRWKVCRSLMTRPSTQSTLVLVSIYVLYWVNLYFYSLCSSFFSWCECCIGLGGCEQGLWH